MSAAVASEQKPIWMDIALAEKDVHETPGPKATKRIIEYDATTTLKATSDEVPWCSSFVNWVIHQARLVDPTIDKETRSAAAISWADWGQELAYGTYGCICVMSRPGGNHVFFYLGEDADGVWAWGGNQSDKVCKAHYSWDNITNFRWPSTWAVPEDSKEENNE